MKKLLNKKGFTLMEMMIVIAIIVILVAIAVPSFNSSLEKANKATDDANLRAAKSLAMVEAVNPPATETTYHFDMPTGKLASDAAKAEDYGKSKDNKSKYIEVVIGTDGTVTAAWK